MKTTLSFYFIAAVAGALACSDEGGTDRNNGGNGGTTQVGNAGSGNTAGSGQGSAGTSSSSAGAGGSGGAGAVSGTPGPLLTITGSGADVVVQDTAGNTNITGGIVLAQSMIMTTAAELTVHEGQLCMKGATAIVQNNDYANTWGAEISLDLNRAANPDAPAGDAGAGDAGAADAGGVLGTVAEPWPVGNVIGFSYKITGMDPAITADQGVSAGAFRFKAVPQGANTAIDTYCSTRTPISGATENVLFSNIQFECWQQSPPNPSLADDPIAYNVGMQGMPSTRPNPRALMSLSWQVPADIMIGHQFDFCISELRPILAP
jgi:hypothetical protein